MKGGVKDLEKARFYLDRLIEREKKSVTPEFRDYILTKFNEYVYVTLPTQYQQFIHLSRYSRWDYEQNRRETWEETVNRYFNFFSKKLDIDFTSTQTLRDLVDAVKNLDVMPSMRCLMTAGPALEKENVAGYNCSYVHIDSPRSFDEIVYTHTHSYEWYWCRL